MAKVNKITDILLSVSDGLLGTLTDFLLFNFYVSAELLNANSPGQIYQAYEKASKSLKGLNYRQFKRALSYLVAKELVTKQTVSKRKREGQIKISLSQNGTKRMNGILSVYKKERSWDGKVYLITYDIPEAKKRKRDLLRAYLKRIGCGLLQESVWLSYYNPKKEVKNFISENGLSSLILISSLGKEGSIGDEDLKTLLNRVFKLKTLSEDYHKFIRKFETKKISSEFEISLAYFNILKNDPQLPFELLPNDWLGDKAYQLLISKLKSIRKR